MRQALGLQEGTSDVILETNSDGLQLTTRALAIAKAQAEIRKYVPPGSHVVDEFLAERQEKSSREDGD